MSEKVFKKGDRVKCVNNDQATSCFVIGNEYEVSGIVRDGYVRLEDIYTVWKAERFELAVVKTRAEEITELETRLAVLKAEEVAERTKAAVEERRKYIDTLCEQIKTKIDQANYQACWYRLIVDGRGIDLTIGSRSSEE